MPEGARVAAAVADGRARELGARTLCWELPHHVDDAVAGGLVEGTVLAAYRFDRFKSDPGEDRPWRPSRSWSAPITTSPRRSRRRP